MFFGGTNYNRTNGYLITTSYDYDAPIDEFGHPSQPKFDHLTKLHRLINKFAPTMLANPIPKPQELGAAQEAFSYGQLSFLCNDASSNATVTFRNVRYTISGFSCQIICKSSCNS